MDFKTIWTHYLQASERPSPRATEIGRAMHERSWETLLDSAFDILDGLREAGLGSPDVVLGGGTVLMMRMRHRLSRDIDLFLHDAQWLARLTPRLNDRVAGMVRDYSEQANSVKLVLSEGDIDFVVAGSVTGSQPQESLEFGGRKIALETTEEILAKKLFFRAALLKPRDAFDLVAASLIGEGAARRAIEASAPRRGAQVNRLRELAGLPPDQLSRDIVPIGEFAGLIPTMIGSALALIEGVDDEVGQIA